MNKELPLPRECLTLEHKVERYIIQKKLIDSGEGIVIGLSGGADSTALLLILSELRKSLKVKLHAVHVNHLLRGDNATQDEVFSRELATRLNVGFTVFHIDVQKVAVERGLSFETAGREVRYEAFRQVATSLGYQKIAVAHHRDDQGETILHHLIRGSGLEGLTGIAAHRSDGLIRPLLCLKREEIERYCHQRKVIPMNDHTNEDTLYTRNYLRQSLIPQINQRFDCDLNERLSQMAEILREENDYIESETLKYWEKACLVEQKHKRIELSVAVMNQSHKAIQRRMIRKAYSRLTQTSQNFFSSHVAAVEQVLLGEGTKRFQIGDVHFVKVYDRLIVNKGGDADADLDEKPLLKIENILEVMTDLSHPGPFSIYLDAAKVKGDLFLRHRMPGDFIIPLGMNGRKKVKSYMIDEKIPLGERDKIWLLCDDENILWIVGYRQSEVARVTKKTQQILRVSLADVVTDC